MRLARSGARDAGIASLRVASSIQRAIRKDVYDAEAVTQVAEDRGTIEPGRSERVDEPASFDTKWRPLVQTSHATKICASSLSRPLSTSCREGRPLRILGALVRAYH
jgi:hypothetical protein